MLGFVLIALHSADERDVKDRLLQLAQVQEAHVLFGEWDLIAKVDTESPEALATFVMDNVRNIPGVKLSSTLIVAK